MNLQLYPLEVNPRTGEVFLRLPLFPRIIITPPRDDDEPALLPILNDIRVCDTITTPYPYTLEHASNRVNLFKGECQTILEQLNKSKDASKPIIVAQCPVKFLREVQADGSDILIGEVSFMRCPRGELMGADGRVLDTPDWENKVEREKENSKLPVGDPNIIWSMGDYLASDYHGKGIMTDAIRTLLHDWGVPRMGIRRVWVATDTGNIVSVKVFQKNGFSLIFSKEEHAEIKGRMKGLNILEWKM